MAEFPSVHKISVQHETMMDPFSGAQNVGIVLPPLSDFLKITQLTHYSSKLKRLKCVETDDLRNLSVRVGFLHVEEQRVRRYLDHFQQKRLKQAEAKAQPVALENFVKISNLPHLLKPMKKLGVVEFDDLHWINYSDLATLLPKKIELFRFKRYLEKISKTADVGVIDSRVKVVVADLKTFIIDAKLKNHKSALEKLGVMESDDLFSVNRSDVPKMTQVEYDRLIRYREKHRVKDKEESAPANLSSPTRGGEISPIGEYAPQFNRSPIGPKPVSASNTNIYVNKEELSTNIVNANIPPSYPPVSPTHQNPLPPLPTRNPPFYHSSSFDGGVQPQPGVGSPYPYGNNFDHQFSPMQLPFNPMQPPFNPMQPHFNPMQPHFNPMQPHFNPVQPPFNPIHSPTHPTAPAWN